MFGAPEHHDADEETVALMRGLKSGDAHSVEALWQSYFPRLVEYLLSSVRRVKCAVDEEQIALDVIAESMEAIRSGRLTHVASAVEFWAMMRVSAKWRFLAQIRCDARRIQREDAAIHRAHGALSTSADADPTASLEYRDQIQMLFRSLPFEDHPITIAGWRLAGFTAEQIAKSYGISKRKVERIWSKDLAIWRNVLQRDGTNYRKVHDAGQRIATRRSRGVKKSQPKTLGSGGDS